MNESQIVDLVHSAFYYAAILAVPILTVCLVIGLVVSIFETVTQIHEQSLAFVPKLVVVLLMLVMMGGWMAGQMETFMRQVFALIAKM